MTDKSIQPRLKPPRKCDDQRRRATPDPRHSRRTGVACCSASPRGGAKIEVHQLTSAYPNLAMDAKSVSTVSLFRKQLSTLFSNENGFRDASSDILVGRDWKSPWPNLPEQCRYFDRFAGQVVTQSTARPIPIGRVIFEQAGNSSTESVLVEYGILFCHAVAK